jgi:hypothetical protein
MLFQNEVPDDENFDELEMVEPRSPRLHRLLTLLLVTTLTIGTTLASNITLGSGQKMEFGQGVQITSACDNDISAKPLAEYNNNLTRPGMYVKAFRLTGISDNCIGALFTLRAYPETGSALALSTKDPAFSLKFHMTNISWMQDMNSCLFFNNVVTGSQTNNSVDLDLSGCYANYNPPTIGRSDQPPLSAQALYKFTLETRPNTIARIDITSNIAGSSIGQTFNTGDEVTTTTAQDSSFNPVFVDLTYGGRFNVYGWIPNGGLTNSGIGSSFYAITTSAGITCTYGGKTDAGASIPSGIFANFITPSAFQAVVYECTATTSGTVAIANYIYGA